jgi:hypothetical protein
VENTGRKVQRKVIVTGYKLFLRIYPSYFAKRIGKPRTKLRVPEKSSSSEIMHMLLIIERAESLIFARFTN